MGFSNPIIGGGGALVYPAIQSPNFSQSAQTGWSIQKNGDAYFFNIIASGTITATKFIGTEFEINASGAFLLLRHRQPRPVRRWPTWQVT
jgi:hypothetical protein